MSENKFFEALYLFSSVFMTGLLLFVLFQSLIFFNNNFPRLLPLSSQMYYLAVGIAIVTVLAQWIEGRIKAIVNSPLLKRKGGKHGRRRRL